METTFSINNKKSRNMVKTNTIKLTDAQLREIVSETVKKVLGENGKHLIMEMPLPRARYKERVDSELPQVFTNWCLVRFRTITDTLPYKKHWKDEFRGHMYATSRLAISSDDSISTRRKVFSEILNEYDYGNPQFLTLTVCNKFIEENLDIRSEAFADTIADCIKSIHNIIDLILERDVQAIRNYTETI
jgi:hypothetical protein